MKTTTVFRLLTVLFVILLICIILAANLGLARGLFRPVYAFPYGDKVGHFILMGILSLLVSLSFRPSRFLGLVLWSVIALCVVVTIEEASQVFLDTRDASLADLAANYAGIYLFGELGALLRRVFVRR